MTARIFRKLSIALALAATTAGAVAPAQAHDGDRYRGGYGQRYDGYGRYNGYRGYDRGRTDVTVRYQYDGRPGPGRYYRDDRYCERSDGTAGTILGAVAGGLVGSSAAGRHGDKTTGAILGGAIGAVAGRAIDRNSDNCR